MCFIFRNLICFSFLEKNAQHFPCAEDKKNPGKWFLFGESIHRAAYRRLNCSSLFLALIRVTRPKEAFQSVFAASRHNVGVKMRHALADAIVHRDEGAMGFQRRLDRTTETLHIPEVWPDQVLGQVGQRFVVCFRNQEAMAGKNWTVVEKSQGYFVFKYEASGHFSTDDLTERA
jgi:hypothetical protein